MIFADEFLLIKSQLISIHHANHFTFFQKYITLAVIILIFFVEGVKKLLINKFISTPK